MPQEGMLVQIDGSHHPWLEDRGPRFVLLLAVDDATGVMAQVVFRTAEDTRGYLALLEGMVRQWGIPLARYSDRHAAFKYDARQVPVLAETTQVARVMRELGVRQIFALSPQAKGRVERMASTFQDRLVTELRLAGASHHRPGQRGPPAVPAPVQRPVSPWPRSSPRKLTAGYLSNCLSPRPSASGTPARWPGTTLSNTTGGSCNCCPG